ncbi:MAG: hypothetical protein U0531_11775 [Dehalococcoidia bacterium]
MAERRHPRRLHRRDADGTLRTTGGDRRLALYLAGDASSFLTGQALYIDGGQSLKKYPEMFTLAPP